MTAWIVLFGRLLGFGNENKYRRGYRRHNARSACYNRSRSRSTSRMKGKTAIIAGLLCLAVSSAAFAAGTPRIVQEFGVWCQNLIVEFSGHGNIYEQRIVSARTDAQNFMLSEVQKIREDLRASAEKVEADALTAEEEKVWNAARANVAEIQTQQATAKTTLTNNIQSNAAAIGDSAVEYLDNIDMDGNPVEPEQPAGTSLQVGGGETPTTDGVAPQQGASTTDGAISTTESTVSTTDGAITTP